MLSGRAATANVMRRARMNHDATAEIREGKRGEPWLNWLNAPNRYRKMRPGLKEGHDHAFGIPDRPHGANLLRRPEGIPQQTKRVQLHQPLTLLHICLPARQVLGVPRVAQAYLESSLFQNVVYRNPVHAGGLHHNMPDAARFQPDQIGRPAAELPYRLGVTRRRHSHIMAFVADIDAPYMLMDNLQSGSSEQSCRVNSLRCLRFILPFIQRSKVDCLRFAMVVFPSCRSDRSARLDPRSLHKLSTGVGPPVARNARHQTTDRRNRSQAVKRAAKARKSRRL